jgi:hypothetical protein
MLALALGAVSGGQVLEHPPVQTDLSFESGE